MTNKEIIGKKQEYINKLKEEKKALKEQNDFLRKQHREDTHKLAEQDKGLSEIYQIERAYHKAICLKYGEKVVDEGEILGYRLILDKPTLDGINYMSYNKDDKKGKVIIGYMPPKKKKK